MASSRESTTNTCPTHGLHLSLRAIERSFIPNNTMLESPPPYPFPSPEISQHSGELVSSTKDQDRVFDDLNYPNILDVIPDADFMANRANLFIAFDHKLKVLRIEDRAFPLLRPPSPPTVPNPKPGFISFIGETGCGKSWILRSLKRREDRARYPPPLVAPGLQRNNFTSTSADVHLYADSATSQSANPILFLDFEGLKGTGTPSSLKARVGDAVMPSNNMNSPRYGFIQDAYPRIAYAFSNCVVFVANGRLGTVESVAKQLTEYSNCGVGGSRHLGFKPALFVIFNQMPVHDLSPSSWSIPDSTRAFLANPGVEDLRQHYHEIFVVKIPQLTNESTNLVIGQLDKLGGFLRKQHLEASTRRVGFRLDFTADQVITYLTRALPVFTNRRNAVFDWLEQSLDQRKMPTSTKIAEDIWTHFFQFFRASHEPVRAFEKARETFYSHFVFCVRLHLARHPLVGRTLVRLPNTFEDAIRKVDDTISRYAPCGGTEDGAKCDSMEATHSEFHTYGTKRWKGTFQHAVEHGYMLKDKVLKSLGQKESREFPNLSVKNSECLPVLSKIRSVYSCVGCLSYPSTFLSCEHGFCEECIEDIAQSKDLHRIVAVKCPFCGEQKGLSLRFLPHAAGYRVLALDGGGICGIAQIKILQAIETRCFGIPIVHLFDFFIGTSIGGQLVLALASRNPPLTLSNAEKPFQKLFRESFIAKKLSKTSILYRFPTSTMYKATALETNLKVLFDKSPHLLSARNAPSPHVAVTTTSRTNNSFEKRLIPNYMRCPIGDSDGEKHRLILSTVPKDCMPTWVAARCTSAAYPYFKRYVWEGEYLLDGGFVANCPAELGLDEARCIWPNRRMDTLVSVGTGAAITPHVDNPAQEYLLQNAKTAVMSSEKIWAEFVTHHESEMGRIFRFQPTYVNVDSFEDISPTATAWLTNNQELIDLTSNQLIASLFFFKPSTLDSQSGTQRGNIECRLPPDLHERQTMVDTLIKEARAHRLFTVDIPGLGRAGEQINKTLCFLEDLSHGTELSIPVTIEQLPLFGQATIDIKLCAIFGSREGRYSISGCPLTIRKE